MKIETILVPTDFSEHADRAFATAIQFAKVFGSRIELVHAYDFGQWASLGEVTFAESLGAKMRLAALEKLDELAGRAKEEGIDVSTRVLLGPPARVIVKCAEETGAGLIVMGTRGMGATKQLFLGSVAARTIQTAPCPVLTVAVDEAGESRSGGATTR